MARGDWWLGMPHWHMLLMKTRSASLWLVTIWCMENLILIFSRGCWNWHAHSPSRLLLIWAAVQVRRPHLEMIRFRFSTSRSPQIVLTFVCALHAGRIVLGAALLQPKLGLCHGIEILPELHEAAIAARVRLDEVAPKLPVAPCEYSALDLYTDAAAEALGSADILFSYSVTWERDEQGRLTELSRALASRLRPGARVITVDVTLLPEVGDVRFVPIASLEGANEETGPASTGHVFQVVKETSKASS